MANGNEDHHHMHHARHGGAAGPTGASAPEHAHRTAPPMEPGYPQHPELTIETLEHSAEENARTVLNMLIERGFVRTEAPESLRDN